MQADTDLSPTTIDESYWLRNCEGFRVEGPDGNLGIVEAVLASDSGEPVELRVARGGLGFRSLMVAADEVESISPHELRITIRETPPAHQGRAARSGHGPLRLIHPLRG